MLIGKRILYILLTIPVTSVFCLVLNLVVDPFGAFGDNFYRMYDYNLSQNARIAKISYLDKHSSEFDSFIIGGSKAGAILPSTLQKYMPENRFYNLCMIGGRFYDYEHTVYYVVNKYHAKKIILNISHLEITKKGTSTGVTGKLHGKLFSDMPVAFYLNLLFQDPLYAIAKLEKYKIWTPKYRSTYFYQIEDGCYNRVPQEELIRTDPEKYYNNISKFPESLKIVKYNYCDYNLKSMKRIVSFCKKENIELLVISSPAYKSEYETYPVDIYSKFLKDIANVIPYWNFFGINSVNADKKSFYDSQHFRNFVGDLILARIFNDTSIETPEDFGVLIDRNNAQVEINKAFSMDIQPTPSIQPTESIQPAVSATPTPSAQPAVSATPTPSAKPAVSATPTPSAKPAVSATPTPKYTATLKCTPTPKLTPAPRYTPTPSPKPRISIRPSASTK